MADVLTISEAKDLLGITTTKHDVYLDTIIPLFVEYIQDYCNNSFIDEYGQVVFKGGAKIALVKMIEFNMNKSGISSRSFGEVSYSYTTDFPPSILTLLQPYSRIRLL
ncbi:phage head-tail connector protein [Mesobacillus foraminis]|uniref:Gp6-like head-tail connector protein n=1 Tax=Mesobacillus foraminis TaxID=279826 RepID=A0A4R2BET9_9BACI|nr:phage head-tail connector protein [Mesobacillus foraminis]TCN25487.1 gp6-like head-tail connector protein [Mesobacillus foraminis]